MLLCKKSRQKVSPQKVLNKKKKKSLHYPTASQCETQGSKMSILMIRDKFHFSLNQLYTGVC